MFQTQPFSNSLEYFISVRRYTESLFKPLLIEDYIPQTAFFISPPKWHLGHTTWFFEEFILKNYYLGYKVFDNKFNFIFNSYYNNVGQRVARHKRGDLTRPSVEKVYQYRQYVDKHMEKLLNKSEDNKLQDLLVLGLNHEQQHQELFLTDFKYILGKNPLFPVYKKDFDLTNQKNTEQGYLLVPEGNYEIGHIGKGFFYDNELSRHRVFLHAFEISKSMIINDEYINFINDDGYKRFDLWLDEAWVWVNENNISAPLYWQHVDGVWQHYTLAGLNPIDGQNMVCHVNYYEAAAFAEWKNMRLPTEYEWEVSSKSINWGSRWEWTSSAYLPYPGFKKPPGAVGEYNGKFMVNQMVLRGASSATSPNHSRNTYRNFFHPHFQWQYSGIRLAKKQIL